MRNVVKTDDGRWVVELSKNGMTDRRGSTFRTKKGAKEEMNKMKYLENMYQTLKENPEIE